MRAHDEPQLYQRSKGLKWTGPAIPGETWWYYWRGERKSCETADKALARKRARDRTAPDYATTRTKTIEDAVRLLYVALETRVSKKTGKPVSQVTKDQAREKLGHFLRLWEGKRLSEINYAVVQAYIDERLRPKDPDVRPAKRLTVSHELGYLHQVWKLASAHEWVTRPWDALLPEGFVRDYQPRKRWLTVEELTKVLRGAKVNGKFVPGLDPAKGSWVAFIVATGADVGDVDRAQPDDIDWKRKLVRVRGTKNAFRDRKVAIQAMTHDLLKLAEEHGPPFPFVTGDDTPADDKRPRWWVNQELRKLAAALKIDHFTPQDLRRPHGQWLRHAGVQPHLIGRMLGHADSKMADNVYASGDEALMGKLVRDAVGRTNVVRIIRTKGQKRVPAAHGTRGK